MKKNFPQSPVTYVISEMTSPNFMTKNRTGFSINTGSETTDNSHVVLGILFVGTFYNTQTHYNNTIFVPTKQTKNPLSQEASALTFMPSIKGVPSPIAPSNTHAPTATSATPSHAAETKLPTQINSKPGTLVGHSTKLNLPTPINVTNLKKHLEGYDPHITKYLLDGFTYGFSLHFDGIEEHFISTNSASALSNHHIVSQKIQHEINKGRIAGPFQSPPFTHFKSSPLALRPKSMPNKFRLLHNLSYPYNHTSVNAGISSAHTSVQYPTIWDALDIAIENGKHSYLAKNDIADAFRLVPLHPDMYHLTGFTWDGQFYYDRVLPQGASPSCKIFQTFSTALSWILQTKYNVPKHLTYLDDFLFLGKTRALCQRYQDSFLNLCSTLSIPIAPHKTVAPCQTLTFLGIEISTEHMHVCLPTDKLNRYSNLIEEHLQHNKITLQQIQQLIGCLHFSTSVITVGRPFIRRLIDKTRGITKPYHYIRLTQEVKQDLHMWLMFLKTYNGRHFLRERIITQSPSINLHTDACPSGFGITFGTNWVYHPYPANWSKLNIAVLELYPIYVAVELFATKISNSNIVFHCDNQAIVSVINCQTSKDSQILAILRPLVLTLLNHNIFFRAKHLSSSQNYLCDRISRSQVTPRLLNNYGLQETPTPLPQRLWPENSRILPSVC